MAYSSYQFMDANRFMGIVGHDNRAIAELRSQNDLDIAIELDEAESVPQNDGGALLENHQGASVYIRSSASVAGAASTSRVKLQASISEDRVSAITDLQLIDKGDPLQSKAPLDSVRNSILQKIFSGDPNHGGVFVRTFVGNDQKFAFATPQYRVAGMTDGKKLRCEDGNEDCLAIAHAKDGSRFYVVGDGVGGSFAGEVASEIIVTVVAQCMAEGDDFNLAVQKACNVLKENRFDLAAWEIIDAICSNPPSSQENFDEWFNAHFGDGSMEDEQELFVWNASRFQVIKTILRDYMLTSWYETGFNDKKFRRCIPELVEALKLEFKNFSGNLFVKEPSTTLAVCHSWESAGKSFKRMITIGDGTALLLKLQFTGGYSVARQTEAHSLTEVMRNEEFFETILGAQGLTGEELDKHVELAYMSHPLNNVILGSVDHAGINIGRIYGYDQVVQDTGVIELDLNERYVLILATDRLKGCLTLQEIKDVVASSSKPETIMRELYAAMHDSYRTYVKKTNLLRRKGTQPEGHRYIPASRFHHHNIRPFYNVNGTLDDTTLVVEVLDRTREVK